MSENTLSSTTQVPPVEQAADGCPACPHPVASHDAVSLRFCAAMSAGGSARRCVCSSTTAGMTYSNSTRGPISGDEDKPRK